MLEHYLIWLLGKDIAYPLGNISFFMLLGIGPLALGMWLASRRL